ncbi:Dynein beta chain, ciliary-like 2, partial [Homarus americanus]
HAAEELRPWTLPRGVRDLDNSILIDSCLKELHPQIPVIFIKAITQDKANRNLYKCPLYKTASVATYVWTFNLKTKKPAKWILAGWLCFFKFKLDLSPPNVAHGSRHISLS